MFSSLYTGQQSQIKYSCNQCDHQASTQGNLKIHIQSVHEKIWYSCNQCDYQAAQNGDLKTHIQSVHEKIKYSCNQCDHQATGKRNLKKNINIMIWGSEDSYSEKFKYSCNQCDHQATGNKHCNEREREGQECPPCTISILVLIQFNVPSVLVFVNLQHYLKDSLPIIRYPCSSCEYKSRNKGKFNSHIQVKHNGGSQKFPCSQCEYKASII